MRSVVVGKINFGESLGRGHQSLQLQFRSILSINAGQLGLTCCTVIDVIFYAVVKSPVGSEIRLYLLRSSRVPEFDHNGHEELMRLSLRVCCHSCALHRFFSCSTASGRPGSPSAGRGQLVRLGVLRGAPNGPPGDCRLARSATRPLCFPTVSTRSGIKS